MNPEQLNGANLAFIGDAYFELYIRDYCIHKGITSTKKLHDATVKYVSRQAQYQLACLMQDKFTAVEKDIFLRGRNYHYKEKSQEYIHASGLEAVIGFLYLTKQEKRLGEMMEQIIALTEDLHG
ncbi:MAG: ribonuclease III domain-containing protein [Bacilli bacterium]|jgi:ribonuclease-3 family protein|nr:ribonuclease III domain-containing protein [Bacilli bacterium]